MNLLMKLLRISKVAAIGLLALGIPTSAYWIGGRVVESRHMREKSLSDCNFSSISGMLLEYHAEHGGFPPATFQTKANWPMHSWRLLLLPYIDVNCRDAYLKYDFSEEWNSPKNLATVKSLPQYANWFSLDNSEIAHYLTIADGDSWPSSKALRARLITKGKDKFLLVEYPDSDGVQLRR
jgi:hypothetical protein